MARLNRIILIIIFISAATNGSQLHAQGKLLMGFSSQIHNTRLMADLSSTHVKGAYRPTEVLFLEREFGKHLAFHSGLGYTMMTQNSDAFKNNFHYLALPLYLKIGRLNADKRLAFTSFIGMDMRYLFKANHISVDGNETDIMEYSQKFQADMAGGVGIKCRLSEKIALEGLFSVSYGSSINSYNAALMDINNLNTGFRLNVSYKF